MATYNEGDQVKWKHGDNWAHGKVQSRFEKKITRTIDGNEVSRDGSSDNAALYIDTDDANNVVKLESEVEKDS